MLVRRSNMFKYFSLFVMFVALLIVGMSAKAEVPADAVSFMFVQSANGVEFKEGTMTLKDVSPSTIFFADRPERMAGHIPTPHFIKIWDEGKDNFKNDPPNANLSILGEKEGATNIVVELTNPRIEGKDFIYDIRVLEGTPPEKGGISTLFIDWWVGPRGAVCHRNWYTGGVWCHYGGPYWGGPWR
jgi:hypothetical protein